MAPVWAYKGGQWNFPLHNNNLIVQKPYDFMESQNQATELAKSLNRFWDIESAGITETSSKVNEDEQFFRFIKFD